MFTSLTQSKIISYISLVVLLVAALVATTVFAQWVNPTGTQQNPSSALNRGPVTQIKDGRISIGSSTQMQSAALEVDGPALLQGGLYVEGAPNISSVILGDVFVGFGGVPGSMSTSSNATYTLTGDVKVSRDIGAKNLTHSLTSGRQPVCTTLEGWLIPCEELAITLCDDPLANNYWGNASQTQAGALTSPQDFENEGYTVFLDPGNDGSYLGSLYNVCTYDGTAPYTGPVDPDLGCFVDGTMIRMADGSLQNIMTIEVGDMVMTSGGPEAVMKKYAIDYTGELYSINGSDYFVSDTHPFMTTDGWKSFNPEGTRLESPTLEVSLLEQGDVLIREDGSHEVLKSVSSRFAEQQVYNLGLNGTRDFYADGYLVHNVDLFPIQTAHAAPVNWKGPSDNDGDGNDGSGNDVVNQCGVPGLTCQPGSVCCQGPQGGNLCIPDPNGVGANVCAS